MICKKEPMSMRKGDMLFNVIHIMTARFIFTSRKNADCHRKSFFNFNVLLNSYMLYLFCLLAIEYIYKIKTDSVHHLKHDFATVFSIKSH